MKKKETSEITITENKQTIVSLPPEIVENVKRSLESYFKIEAPEKVSILVQEELSKQNLRTATLDNETIGIIGSLTTGISSVAAGLGLYVAGSPFATLLIYPAIASLLSLGILFHVKSKRAIETVD